MSLRIYLVGSLFCQCASSNINNESSKASLQVLTRYIVLPKPTGPFSVATKFIHVEDPTRKLFNSDKKRHWMIQVYFPSNPPSKPSILRQRGTYPYAPNHLQAGLVSEMFVESYASPYGGVVHDWKGPFPLVIFAPSLNFSRYDYSIFCEELASYGFFVLVMDTPYVTSLVNLNDMSLITPSLLDLWNFYKNPEKKNKMIRSFFKEYQNDLIWILNNLKSLADYLNVTFDENRIVLFGHADGAAALRALFVDDPRTSALIEYYPVLPDDLHMKMPSKKICAKPMMTIYTSDSKVKDTSPTLSCFMFVFDTVQNKSFEKSQFINQGTFTVDAEKDAITDFGLLSSHIPPILEKSSYRSFIKWLFKEEPNIDTRFLKINKVSPEKWVKNMRFTIISWLQKNNFIPTLNEPNKKN